jgi:hypothetical protein
VARSSCSSFILTTFDLFDKKTKLTILFFQQTSQAVQNLDFFFPPLEPQFLSNQEVLPTTVGRSKLNAVAVEPQLESAWFQPLTSMK